jgi:excinuclease ABC subunit B
MQAAIDETARRRKIQEDYNSKHGITPKTIKKAIRENIRGIEVEDESVSLQDKYNKMNPKAKEEFIEGLRQEMKDAAKALDFEAAADLRDVILQLEMD